jgi:cell fate regulator YaaT (PSP1 superfamily)
VITVSLVKIFLPSVKKCCLLNPGAVAVKLDDPVMVEHENSLHLGRVVEVLPELDLPLPPEQVKPLVRLATPEDQAQEKKNRLLEERAFQFCQKRVQALQLPIYLVQVRVLFDASKVIFYFTAPGRVDFRELVKDLVHEFRTRIELRQIGVRHRAKMAGGLGICGRGLCCASFLADFAPVSVRMAKEQQLSLNPNKISGICGRLMCCLAFEHDNYQEIRKRLPRVGKRLVLPEGEGKIVRYNLLRETVTLEMADKKEVEIPLSQLPAGKPGGETAEPKG